MQNRYAAVTDSREVRWSDVRSRLATACTPGLAVAGELRTPEEASAAAEVMEWRITCQYAAA